MHALATEQPDQLEEAEDANDAQGLERRDILTRGIDEGEYIKDRRHDREQIERQPAADGEGEG